MDRTLAALTRHVRRLVVHRPGDADPRSPRPQYPRRDETVTQSLALLDAYRGLLNPEQDDYSASTRSLPSS